MAFLSISTKDTKFHCFHQLEEGFCKYSSCQNMLNCILSNDSE